MDVRIAGGHGQIARLLTRQLSDRGDAVHGIIRKPDQAQDLRDDGATPIILDLEDAEVETLADEIRGADAVVFAAGSGPGSGPERKWTVDCDGAVKLRRAAELAGVGRYVMVSSMGADDAPAEEPGEDDFAVYLRAKAAAEQDLRSSTLAWTIVRPGALTDDDATGAVLLGEHVDRGEIPREDVATVLRACLDDDRTAGRVIEAVRGDTPVVDAVVGVTDERD